ncbi:hypothetical protein SESBI_41454 [Sesbania bispinosa]|nr:hypothetical protein SESBI_41454 [Sesbania bispinosa]
MEGRTANRTCSVEAQPSNVDVQQEGRTAYRTRSWAMVFALEYTTEKERPRRRLHKLIPFQFRDRRREGISHFSDVQRGGTAEQRGRAAGRENCKPDTAVGDGFRA